MTRVQIARYHRLLGEIHRAHYDMPLTNRPEQLTGRTKRRATLAAKRLMQASRRLWELLAIEAQS